jgi:hypothetical protein
MIHKAFFSAFVAAGFMIVIVVVNMAMATQCNPILNIKPLLRKENGMV